MKFIDIFNNCVRDIVKNRNQKRAVERLSLYIKENGFPITASKDNCIKHLKQIHDEVVDAERQTLALLTFSKVTAPKLTSYQKDRIKEVIDIIKKAKILNKCKHENVCLTASLHGGGFTPMMPLPEVICPDCGVNVTLYSKDLKVLKTDFGISITKKGLDSIISWLKSIINNRLRTGFGEDVVKDPVEFLKNTQAKWEDKIPFKICDVQLFNARSGK